MEEAVGTTATGAVGEERMLSQEEVQGAAGKEGVVQLSEEDMEANARLKERALRFWLSMVSQPVTLHMYENTTVEGVLCAVDAGQELLQVSGLATPMYSYPEALVRTSDVRCLVAAPATLPATSAPAAMYDNGDGAAPPTRLG